MKKIISLLFVILVSTNFAYSEEIDGAKQAMVDSIKHSISPGAGNIQNERSPNRSWIWQSEIEPYDTGWGLYIDNDLFTLRQEDQDYTGGFSLTLAGQRAIEYPVSLDPILEKMDAFTGFSGIKDRSDRQLHSLEVGFTVFTPDAIGDLAMQSGDRPYATILYLSNTEESIDLENDTAWISSFSLGILGSPLISELQTELHDLLGSDTPVGWSNQISDGGELTFKYSVAKQSLLDFEYSEKRNYEISTTKQLSVGYITEATFGIAGRIGKFQSPWYSFRPQFNDYSEKSASLVGLSQNQEEFYFWGGINLHVRAYNALLQGQFKDSAVTYEADEIQNLVAEGWIGVTKQFQSGWRLSYLLRAQTSEVKIGKADRNVYWGGIILSKGW